LSAMLQGARPAERQMAILAELQKRGKLDKTTKIGNQDLSTWLHENGQVFSDYGQGKLKGDIDKTLSSNDTMRMVAKAQGAVTVEDKNGVLGTPGATVSAIQLSQKAASEAREARDVRESLQERVKNGEKVSDIALNANFQEIQKAESAKADADAAMDGIRMSDDEGVMGAAGEMRSAGELMRAASEKFYDGMTKKDIGETRPDQIFDGKGKFGLDENAIKALGRAVAHGMAVKVPTLVPSTIGKIDSWKKLQSFADEYDNAIESAFKNNSIDEALRKKLHEAFKKSLGNRLVEESHEADHAAPAIHAAPAAAPAKSGGASSGGGGGH
jgi:hypothetical protein